MDEPGSHPGYLVCGNRRADTAAAQSDPARNVPTGDRAGERNNEIRVVVVVLGMVGSEVDDLVTGFAQRSRYLLLESEAAMIGGNPDAHHELAEDCKTTSCARLHTLSMLNP